VTSQLYELRPTPDAPLFRTPQPDFFSPEKLERFSVSVSDGKVAMDYRIGDIYNMQVRLHFFPMNLEQT